MSAPRKKKDAPKPEEAPPLDASEEGETALTRAAERKDRVCAYPECEVPLGRERADYCPDHVIWPQAEGA